MVSLNCHLWEFVKLTILSGICALCDHVCLPVKEIFFPVVHVETYNSCWKCLLTVNGERHWEMFYAWSSCLRNAHPCASRQKPPRALSREVSSRSSPWWGRDFFFQLLKKYEPVFCFLCLISFFFLVKYLLFFGINWRCGLKWHGVLNGSLDVGSGHILETSFFHRLANPGHFIGKHLVWLVATVTK